MSRKLIAKRLKPDSDPCECLQDMGQRIRIARVAMKLKQTDLARLIGVKSSGVISNWENGVAKPDLCNLARLCHVLHVEPSFLLGCHTSKYAPPENATPLEAHIVSLLHVLDEDAQNMIASWLEYYTGFRRQ